MSDDWLTEDPFADEDDPAARERAERRAERERKRQEKSGKGNSQPPPQPAQPPEPAAPPPPKRSPEQEFWDEDPEPATAPAEPHGDPLASAAGLGSGTVVPPANAQTPAEPSGERRRRGFLRRRKETGETGIVPAPAPEGAFGADATADPPPAAPSSLAAAAAAERAGAAESAGAAGIAAASAAAAPQGASGEPEPGRQPTAPDGTSPAPDGPESPPDQSMTPPGEPPASPSPEATGQHPVQDQAGPLPGQTSEEWAAVPAARGDWEDFADSAYHDDGNPEMAGAARSGRRHGEGGGGRGGFLGAILGHPFRIAALIVLLLLLWFLNSLFQPFHGDGHGRVSLRIPKGSSVSEVGELLERKGVISGGTFGIIDGSTLFQVRTTIAGKRSDLIAGPHVLQRDMSYGDAIDALSKEPSKKAAAGGPHEVTIPEGYTRGQAAQIIREDGVPGNYKKATVKSNYLDPAQYGGKQAKTLEGFLFPDTFQLKRKAPVKDLVQLQLEDFKRRIKQVNMKYAKSKNLTVYDVVTIASMIEREAGVPKQRKLVASVIYNRLHEGIPLGIDATIRYATGNYEKPLTESQLATDSPYNTRLNQGLPPGPINSPGLASLQAAAHPAKTDYLYYVNDPKSCNELTFTKTNEEFEEAVQAYEQAREANGGNAPSTCGQ